MATEPPKWAPAQASARAKALWEESFWSRARRLIRPDPNILDTYLPYLLESFTYQQFEYAIRTNYNILPQLDQKSLLTHPLFGGPGRAVIRIQWRFIRDGLLNPGLVRERIRTFDPVKASLFDTPAGWHYLIWMLYHVLWLLYDRGRVGDKVEPDMRVNPPPGTCPLHNGLCQEPAPPSV